MEEEGKWGEEKRQKERGSERHTQISGKRQKYPKPHRSTERARGRERQRQTHTQRSAEIGGRGGGERERDRREECGGKERRKGWGVREWKERRKEKEKSGETWEGEKGREGRKETGTGAERGPYGRRSSCLGEAWPEAPGGGDFEEARLAGERELPL